MKHRTSFLILSAFILILFQREVSAQSIPLMIPHSGTVSVNGAPFNGNGFFKFAIVNDTGNVLGGQTTIHISMEQNLTQP